ncbi:MAG: sigma-54 dependent transcriptional regulator [Desulfobacterales bacterium]|jgi:DNA-binding NtrC family response regulator|nr:sigma-54 dependent transcriptional regulator [Desulfobacterales bacterium]
MPDRLLIIGEFGNEVDACADALAQDFNLSLAATLEDARKRLQKEAYALILFDGGEPGEPLAEMIRALQQLSPSTPIIAASRYGQADLIVEAVRAGAVDFLSRPLVAEKLKLSVRRVMETRSLKNEVDYLRREQDVTYDTDRIISTSPAMQQAMASIRRLAQTESTILVTGETGTGKSFVSGNIHFNSPRRRKPFIKVNCANIPETLLESELFGHERGAFTGADKTRVGRFEQAHGGTLFLDEFCELSFGLQSKLLRVLEDKSFERLGGNKTIQTDVRVIAATNRDIEVLVNQGHFREDLYYRINVLRIHLPPLRDRRTDIEPLAHYLLAKLCRSLKKRMDGFSAEVLRLLQGYDWPGNIRQLSNVIERAILMEEGTCIQPESLLLPQIRRPAEAPEPAPAVLRLTETQEKDMILRALEENLWIQKDAARQLDISPRALNYRVKKLGIAHHRWRKNK